MRSQYVSGVTFEDKSELVPHHGMNIARGLLCKQVRKAYDTSKSLPPGELTNEIIQRIKDVEKQIIGENRRW